MIGLLYASVGDMIGSGWLFGALHAAMAAGPWSVLSWIIGAVATLFLAFVFAELSTTFPNSGALVHMTHVSHGDLVGKIWSWILFLAFVSVPPVEVTSVVTYANNYIHGLIVPTTGVLTHFGTVVSIILLAIVVALNFLAIRIVVAINSAATWWKVLIPLSTIAILMAYSFHPENMTAHLASTPVSGIFTAVATAGVAFSFLGFQQAIALAGETRNPGRYIPIALVGSVIISTLIYIGLQVSFIIALKPSDIAGGWTHLQFSGMFGPLAAIAVAVGAFWWAVVLYVDAFVSPMGTAFDGRHRAVQFLHRHVDPGDLQRFHPRRRAMVRTTRRGGAKGRGLHPGPGVPWHRYRLTRSRRQHRIRVRAGSAIAAATSERATSADPASIV
ncbi:MAG: APC family permease [Rhodanobacteraceae bacterium]